jgi:methenyltetrahydrofolate cyclohydrolase
MKVIAEHADEPRSPSFDLADADSVASAAFAAARQMAKYEGRPGWRSALRSARDEAVNPPLALATVASEVANLAVELVNDGNPYLRSDAFAAAQFASTTAATAAHLVGVNVGPAVESDHRLEQANHLVAASETAERDAASSGAH